MSQIEQIVEESKKSGAIYYQNKYDGALYSIDPPETLFGYTYHAHMIPPFKPESTLILGYGQGQIAHLMRKIWGSGVKITAVDIEKYPSKFIEYKTKTMDAYEYVKDCTGSILKTRFDYICVDIWNGLKVPDFVLDVEFAVRLKQMAKKLVCINILQSNMRKINNTFENYGGFKLDRGVPVEANCVMWWSVPVEEDERKN